MAFSDELDLMSEDTQSILSSEALVVRRVRPEGDIDPDTFERTETTDSFSSNAVAGEPVVIRDPDTARRVTLSTWVLRAEDCDFRPSSKGYFTDASGARWRIVSVADQQVGREYLITAQRMA